MSAASPAVTRSNGQAVTGFVCGLVGLVTSVFLFVLIFPLILDVAGIVYATKGRRNAAAGASQGGLATAGLILGILGLIVFVLWWVLIAVGARSR
jgi:hypothetical protein